MKELRDKTILLVEDEAVTARIETHKLTSYGYRVKHTQTGEHAVDMVCRQGEPVDLILMDIDLGAGIDGTEAARRILQNRDIPVVFLSSHTELEIVEKTEKITSYGYVVKQSGITVLDASIKMAFKLHDSKMKEKRKEEELSESELKFFTMFQTAPAGISLATIPDGSLHDVNRAWLDITGFSARDEVVENPSPTWGS